MEGALQRLPLRVPPRVHASTCAFYESLETEPWSATATSNFGRAFVRACCELHDEARGNRASPRPMVRDELPWPFKPKLHLFLHLVEEQVLELGNPRDFWTYSDETLMGVARAPGGSLNKSSRDSNQRESVDL